MCEPSGGLDPVRDIVEVVDDTVDSGVVDKIGGGHL
jgi:hypothetical protein